MSEIRGQSIAGNQKYHAPGDGREAVAPIADPDYAKTGQIMQNLCTGEMQASVPNEPLATSLGHIDASSIQVRATNPDLDATISAIVELQKQRVFTIKTQGRLDRATEAFVSRYLGYRSDALPVERKRMWFEARLIRKSIEKEGLGKLANPADSALSAGNDGQKGVDNLHVHAAVACAPIILNSATSRITWDRHRHHVEAEMRRLARTLPGYEWAARVRGFGDLGMAIIIGETGDLNNYATKERVWKRLGLAVIGGEAQQKKTGSEALAHGYSPRRRAEIWTIGDSLLRHQWQGGAAVGPYGVVYRNRKSNTLPRLEWSDGRRDNDARRIMTKSLVEDLWRAWRKSSGSGLLSQTSESD